MQPYFFFAVAFAFSIAALAQERVMVGAIRWDAWHGKLGAPGQAVEKALAPARWQDRVPFFAEVRGDDDITIDGTAPGVMDREIEYARQAGLDYWAFVTYSEDNSMSLAIKQYLASDRRADINFCLITEAPRWKNPEFARRVEQLVLEKGYQQVVDGRPLIFLGFINDKEIAADYGSVAEFRRVIDGFRETIMARGMKRPYVVIMDYDATRGERWRRELDADALSSYAVQGNASGGSYGDLCRFAEGFWEQCRAQGSAVVPLAMAGWDRRPRMVRPMPWEAWQKPGEGLDRFYERATPEELAAHVSKAVAWTKQNSAAAPAQAVIIYAWNENDEGGWIVPTRGEGTSRVDALGKAATD